MRREAVRLAVGAGRDAYVLVNSGLRGMRR